MCKTPSRIVVLFMTISGFPKIVVDMPLVGPNVQLRKRVIVVGDRMIRHANR
jgi:hypothetical protein